MSAAVTDLRLRRGAEHVCRLGPCALAELLAEVGAQHGIHDEVVRALAAYQRVTPGMLRAAGGDRFPVQIQEVPR